MFEYCICCYSLHRWTIDEYRKAKDPLSAVKIALCQNHSCCCGEIGYASEAFILLYKKLADELVDSFIDVDPGLIIMN
jgi:hypothetical protein